MRVSKFSNGRIQIFFCMKDTEVSRSVYRFDWINFRNKNRLHDNSRGMSFQYYVNKQGEVLAAVIIGDCGWE